MSFHTETATKTNLCYVWFCRAQLC